MNRRTFLKVLGAAIAAVPLLGSTQEAVVASPIEALPVKQSTKTKIPVKVLYVPPVYPSLRDPMGQMGTLGWKATFPNGKTYGDYILITDIGSGDFLPEALKTLREHADMKAALIDPTVTLDMGRLFVSDATDTSHIKTLTVYKF